MFARAPSATRFGSPLRAAFALLNRLLPHEEASAHCDIPCGIYDPHLLQLAALTVVRMDQLINDVQAPAAGAGGMPSKEERQRFIHAITRYTEVKEEHAELAKREARIIWGDFFKPEHLEKFPDLHQTVFNIMKLASAARQNVDTDAAQKLLAAANRFAEIFWEAKGVATKRQPSNQAAGGEYVMPAN
jgi:nickel superoxide dismutase